MLSLQVILLTWYLSTIRYLSLGVAMFLNWIDLYPLGHMTLLKYLFIFLYRLELSA